MRVAGLIVWVAGFATSLVLLWIGVYRVLEPAQTDSPLCVGVDLPWFLAGVLVNLSAAGVAAAMSHAGWWAIGIAVPALVASTVALFLPCSFVLPLALPVVAIIAIGSAVVVIVRRNR